MESQTEKKLNNMKDGNLSSTPEKENTTTEKTLTTIANIILVLGIIATIICVFALAFPEERYGIDREFNASGFATTLIVLFSTLISWSLMRVIANISNTLKEINKTIKKQ